MYLISTKYLRNNANVKYIYTTELDPLAYLSYTEIVKNNILTGQS